MTQLESARAGIVTHEMKLIALDEGLDAEKLMALVAEGGVVIPANRNRPRSMYHGIGKSLRVKINANIGTSPLNDSIDDELTKLSAAVSLGAEAVMDLSIAGKIDETRKAVLKHASVMVGTVPIYQCMSEHGGIPASVTGDDMIDAIRRHAEDGVDFVTVHCGVTRANAAKGADRLMGIVSRGGSFIAKWMDFHAEENPLFERYDEVLAIAKKHDVTLSLGDALRPGALADAGDEAQFGELATLGLLAQRARDAGVQVMIEGPGHVPLDAVVSHIEAIDRLCGGAPSYVLGPLVTDRAPGYDHIAGAIGGALAGFAGAAFLCYLTPAEHLRLPTVDDVREGVIASKIAAHAADVAKGNQKAVSENAAFSKMRRDFDWEGMFTHAIDPCKPRAYRSGSTHSAAAECSMCGEFCAMKKLEG
jgi:phosphomethylpyrimidine synthase